MTPAPASSPPAISAVIIRGRRIARSALSPSKLVQRQPSHVGPSDNVTAKLPRVIKHNNRKPVFENSRWVVARDAGWDGRADINRLRLNNANNTGTPINAVAATVGENMSLNIKVRCWAMPLDMKP